MREFSLGEDWSVAILEHDFHRLSGFAPRIARNEVHFVEVQHLAILLGCAVAVAHIHHIILHILLHHIPWSATQPKALALTDGVEPESVVLAKFFACFDFNNRALLHAKVATDKVVVVNLSEETDALAVLAVGVGHVHLLSDAAHFPLWQIADGEHQVQQLLVGDLSQEVGLVFHRVNSHCQIFGIAHECGVGVVPCGSHVEILAPALLKIAKLNHAVAHHIGIWSEPLLHGAERIFHHIVPIFLMQRHHFKWQAVFLGNQRTHFNIFFCGTVALVGVHSYTDIEQLEVVVSFLFQFMNHHCAIHAARNQYCYTHIVIRSL